jgi:hypothetical protein
MPFPHTLLETPQGCQVEEDALSDVGQEGRGLIFADGVVARLVEAKAQTPEGDAALEC